MTLKGHKYIKATRDYLDYLEEHFNNIEKAFDEITKACGHFASVADEAAWHSLKEEVQNHDLSKFSPEEFTQYRNRWHTTQGELMNTEAWNKAWKHHYTNNTHHAESIRNHQDYPGVTERDLLHMVIDWTAMSYKFGDSAESYYNCNKHNIKLTTSQIKFLLEIFTAIKEYRES